jgi:hypothetical protein
LANGEMRGNFIPEEISMKLPDEEFCGGICAQRHRSRGQTLKKTPPVLRAAFCGK